MSAAHLRKHVPNRRAASKVHYRKHEVTRQRARGRSGSPDSTQRAPAGRCYRRAACAVAHVTATRRGRVHTLPQRSAARCLGYRSAPSRPVSPVLSGVVRERRCSTARTLPIVAAPLTSAASRGRRGRARARRCWRARCACPQRRTRRPAGGSIARRCAARARRRHADRSSCPARRRGPFTVRVRSPVP